ncbi:glycosyltransferase family 9 protein [Kribbella turkmenica]|uniref:Glycosyltransferase family 9 protein n=1 Tax=Kribbella turkmenica TaxID=2530375 RepID=A0A4R4X0Q0_9ACTN|nr:glycosyltransferase family 9 protein [Kribbella turkmenica]TDD23753.1 glycosyltransferase family 9 protein [Kribbella turkmenica]
MRSVLVARMDNDGDVLLAGPAVRAIAARDRVTLLVAPSGEQAARLLPGVRNVLTWPCPWTGFSPPPVERRSVDTLIDALALEQFGAGFILTSYHQSPLPLALVLRLAGLKYLAANCVDYPGSLLDLRHRPRPGHEVERNLDLVRAAGYDLPPGDDGSLRVRQVRPPAQHAYVVVHPGASVPARTASPDWFRALVTALTGAGHRVLVTGSPAERELTRFVAGDNGIDRGGTTRYAELAALLDGADCAVVGNTGPAHLAAAVGTPVVSLFAPVVPPDRWAPWRVPAILLGDQQAPCRDTRARECPIPGHPCLNGVAIEEAVIAVHKLLEEVA